MRQIYDYIARDSLHYAREVVLTIIESIRTIEPFPLKGRIVPEIQDDTIRNIRLLLPYHIQNPQYR